MQLKVVLKIGVGSDRTDDTHLLTERSTAAECDDLRDSLEDDYGPTYEDEECDDLEPLLLCRLNQGKNVDSIRQNCTLQETYNGTSCVDAQNLMDIDDWSMETDDIIIDIVINTHDCTPCDEPDPDVGCRTIIFTKVNCEGSQGCPGQEEFEYSYSAEVYCCE